MLRSFGEGNQKIPFRLRAGDDAASGLGGEGGKSGGGERGMSRTSLPLTAVTALSLLLGQFVCRKLLTNFYYLDFLTSCPT
jgi:hypothetical protein